MSETTDAIKKWAIAALIRAVRTAAQTAASLVGVNAVGITDVNWSVVASAAALSAVVSFLMAVAGLPEVEDGMSLAELFEV